MEFVESHARTVGIVMSLIAIVGVPAVLFWPAIFGGVPIGHVPKLAKWLSLISALLGMWLFAVSCCASKGDVERVLEPFQSGEGWVLVSFLPFMLYVGTRSVWRRTLGRDSSGAAE